jgi:hypothetical protein
MKKALVTLDIKYNKNITNITYPYMREYAKKIGAEFIIISKRKFPHLSANMEKFQLYEISKDYDWTIFIDADALVHPNCPDLTEIYRKDYVVFNRCDYYPFRFKHNNYVRRDGRNLGATTWICAFSDWNRHLWKPHEDPNQFLDQINPMDLEKNFGYTSSHILDDYIVSRNIAKYGLKVETFCDMIPKDTMGEINYWFTHNFCISEEEKLSSLKNADNYIKNAKFEAQLKKQKQENTEKFWSW